MTTPYNIYIANGTQDEFQYEFNIPGSYSNVFVWIRLPAEGSDPQLLTVGSDYTHNISTSTITFAEPTESGTIVGIYRFTNRTRGSFFLGGQTLGPSSLNQDPDRLTAVTQEIEAGIGEWVGQSTSGGSALGDYMQKTFDLTAWQAQGLEVKNASPATVGSSLVTLDQAIGILTGTNPAFLDQSSVFSGIGNGVATMFVLSGAPPGEYKRTSLFVHVAGIFQSVLQDSDGLFVYDVFNASDEDHPFHDEWTQFQEDGDIEALPEGYFDDPVVVFSTAPEDDAKVEIRFMFGTAQVTLPEQVLTSQNIANGAIHIPLHIAPISSSSESLRVLRFAANGNPSIAVVQADWIEGFNDKVRTNRLDQMAVPQANVSMNNRAITNVATPGGGAPPHQAATKGYVDQQIASGMGSDGQSFAKNDVTVPALNNGVGGGSIATDWFDVTFMPRVVFVNIAAPSIAGSRGDHAAVFADSQTSTRSILMGALGSDNQGGSITVQRRKQGNVWQIRLSRASGTGQSSYNAHLVALP